MADDFHVWPQVWPSQCRIKNPRRTIVCLWWWTHFHQSLWSCAVSSGGTKEQTLLLWGEKPPLARFRAVKSLSAKLWKIQCIQYHWPPWGISFVTASLIPCISASRRESCCHIPSHPALPYPGLTTGLVSPPRQNDRGLFPQTSLTAIKWIEL